MLNVGEFATLGQVSPRMLRHYDQLGLLAPERVAPETGYRSDGVQQLVRLHRLLALRDLGFTLERISGLLDGEPPLEAPPRPMAARACCWSAPLSSGTSSASGPRRSGAPTSTTARSTSR
jgi:DNA-binding transcriptional MerR regulator